jgi:hypothetical protein
MKKKKSSTYMVEMVNRNLRRATHQMEAFGEEYVSDDEYIKIDPEEEAIQGPTEDDESPVKPSKRKTRQSKPLAKKEDEESFESSEDTPAAKQSSFTQWLSRTRCNSATRRAGARMVYAENQL